MSFKKHVSPEELANMVNPPNCISLSQIGKMYNVTRQRVHQVLKEYKKERPELFVERTFPSKQELEKLLEKNISLVSIANHFNISTSRLRKLMDEYGLKKEFIKDKLDKETLCTLFIKQRKTDEEIAKMYNCSKNTVKKLRYQYGIIMRPSKKGNS